MSQLRWGVLLSYASMALATLVSFIYTPFMLRLLGQEEYGLYSLVASVVSHLGLLSFGFGSAYIRFYSRAVADEDEGKVAQLNGLFLLVFVAIGLIATIVGVFLSANIGVVLGERLSSEELTTARILMSLMTITVAVTFPASIFSSFVLANERFVFQRVVHIVQTLLGPLMSLIVLILGYGSIGMAFTALAVTLMTTTVNVYFCVAKLKMSFGFRDLELSLFSEIAVFSSYIFVNMLVDQINWNVDKFILGRIGGTVPVAVYGLAAQLNGYYLAIGSTVSSVFIPRVHRLVAAGGAAEGLSKLLARIGRIQFLVLMLVASGLIVFGRPFLGRWAGSDYLASYPIVLLMVLPVTIPLIQNLGIEIQRAKNLHKFRSWLYVGIAVVNVAVSIPLAQRYGGVGAAMGTAGALLIGNGLIMNIYYHKRVGIDIRYFWKAIAGFVPALVPVALTGAAIMYFANVSSISGMLLWGLIYVGVYSVAMWFLGMNDYERDLIRRPAMRLRARLMTP